MGISMGGGPLSMTNRLADQVVLAESDQRQEEVGDQLEERARQSAEQHQLLPGSGRDSPLLERLAQQERLLRAAYQYYRQSSEEELALSYAAEWLLDNYYIIQQ